MMPRTTEGWALVAAGLPLLTVLAALALGVVRAANPLVLLGVVTLSAAAALLLGTGLVAWGLTGARQLLLVAGLLDLALSAALLAPALNLLRYPLINDITTDPGAPPRFEHAPGLPANAGRDMAFPPGFIEPLRKHYPGLAPLHAGPAPDKVFQAAVETARSMPGWTVTYVDEEARTLEAVAETRLLGFRDDIAVRVSPGETGGASIDMRSKSRLGTADFGTNARRIQAYFAALKRRGGD